MKILAFLVAVVVAVVICEVPCAETGHTGTTTKTLPDTQATFSLQRLTVLKKGHSDRSRWSKVTTLAQSDDSKCLAWGNDKGSVWVYYLDKKKLRLIYDMEHAKYTDVRSVEDVRFDQKGRLLWLDVSGNIMMASIHDPKKVNVQKKLSGKRYLMCGKLLPGKLVRNASPRSDIWRTDALKIVDMKTGESQITKAVFPNQRGVNQLIRYISVSKDLKLILAVSDGNSALIDTKGAKILKRFGQGWGESAAFSPSSRRCALGTDGRGVFIWETNTGKLVRKFELGRAAVIGTLTFLSEDVLYASSGARSEIYRLDITSGKASVLSRISHCSIMQLSKSGKHLYVGFRHGEVELYEIYGEEEMPTTVPIHEREK